MFVSLRRLIEERKIKLVVLDEAIDESGLYKIDAFGRALIATEEDRAAAKRLLENQESWDPEVHGSLSPLELPEERGDPYGMYGWPDERLPNFEALEIKWIERPARGQPIPKKIQIKAPTVFVNRLMRLLLDIQKRDSKFDVDAMPGTREDFHEAAKVRDAEFRCATDTFNTYIKGLCTFKSGATRSNYYKNLFP